MSGRLKLRDIFNEDLDKLFSYSTPMLVLIKDKNLGLLKILINTAILIYFVIYVLVMKKAYLQEEYSTGTAIVYATGTAVTLEGSTVRVWDSVDVAFPQYDPNAIVIGTIVNEEIKQTRGLCVDDSRLCESNADCLPGGLCQSGLCNETGWCSNTFKKQYVLDGVENFVMWFQGNINFITMAPNDEFTTIDQTKAVIYPEGDANSYLLADILKIGEIEYENIQKSGAVIRVRLKWDCDITWNNDCSPSLKTERIDDIGEVPIGFTYDRYFYYKDQGVEYRDHQSIVGIKIIVESSGKAYAVTISSIIINLSSAINLTMLTPIIVDFLMLSVLKNRNFYRERKYKKTDDLDKPTEKKNTKEEYGRIGLPQENKNEVKDEDTQDNHFQKNLP